MEHHIDGSHEPALAIRKYFLTSTPKSAEKNMKNSTIAFFHREQSAHQFRNKPSSSSHGKKCSTLRHLVRFGVACIQGTSAIPLLGFGNAGKTLSIRSLYFLNQKVQFFQVPTALKCRKMPGTGHQVRLALIFLSITNGKV